jgi:DNA modification methylase
MTRFTPTRKRKLKLLRCYHADNPATRIFVSRFEDILSDLHTHGPYDVVFLDPPFNIGENYGPQVSDSLPDEEYIRNLYKWIGAAVALLSDRGSLWMNLPDKWAATAHLRASLSLVPINWCIWHYRFGQHTAHRFISSKSHVLFFARSLRNRIWNPDAILEESDRASKYSDPRITRSPRQGRRVPFDVWQGSGFSRVQGNNRERQPHSPNQLPEAYLERLLRCCTLRDSRVLDPFLGSGTTLVVARALGLESVGVEVNPHTAARAHTRILRGPSRPLGEPT